MGISFSKNKKKACDNKIKFYYIKFCLFVLNFVSFVRRIIGEKSDIKKWFVLM